MRMSFNQMQYVVYEYKRCHITLCQNNHRISSITSDKNLLLNELQLQNGLTNVP